MSKSNRSEERFLQVGDPIPDLSLPTLAGGMTHLREFIGMKLILFMRASW